MKGEEQHTSAEAGTYIPDILHEDNHVIVVNKPAGMLTQGDAGGETSLLDHLRRYIKVRDNKPGNVFLGMVQRLDKPVSGVLVFAKTSKGAKRLSEQIRNRQVLKFYVAVTPSTSTDNDISTDGRGWQELQDHLLREGSRTFVRSTPDERTQTGVLQVKTLFANDAHHLHLIRLITGRKHQIRAQLSAHRTPIYGDAKYGSQTGLSGGRILLHAYLVKFTHPTRRSDLVISSPPPEEFLCLFDETERGHITSRLSGLVDDVSGR